MVSEVGHVRKNDDQGGKDDDKGVGASVDDGGEACKVEEFAQSESIHRHPETRGWKQSYLTINLFLFILLLFYLNQNSF